MNKANAIVTYDKDEDTLRITMAEDDGLGWMRLVGAMDDPIKIGLSLVTQKLVAVIIPNFSERLRDQDVSDALRGFDPSRSE